MMEQRFENKEGHNVHCKAVKKTQGERKCIMSLVESIWQKNDAKKVQGDKQLAQCVLNENCSEAKARKVLIQVARAYADACGDMDKPQIAKLRSSPDFPAQLLVIPVS